MQRLVRLLGILALLGIAGFCIVGFMAASEYADAAKRLPWQIGYGLLGLVCLRGLARLFASKHAAKN